MRAFLDRWAPWLAGAVLVAGVASYVATRVVGGGAAAPAVASLPSGLAPAERQVALEFVRTAVARTDLAKAWTLVAPDLKQGMTLAQWKTGSIPVVPAKVSGEPIRVQVVTSFTDHAELDVLLGAAAYRLGLQQVGGRWLVSSWVPAHVVSP